MFGTRQPAAPPLSVGARVRYNGNGFAHETNGVTTWVRRGDVGTVIKLNDGLPPVPGIDEDPMDGWATVRFGEDSGNDRALTARDFEACSGSVDEWGLCAKHFGRFEYAAGGDCSRRFEWEAI